MDEKEIIKEFGRNLCAERNRAGLSQEGLALKAGITSGGKHIGTIERGETNTSVLYLIYILKALNISFDKLFDVSKLN